MIEILQVGEVVIKMPVFPYVIIGILLVTTIFKMWFD